MKTTRHGRFAVVEYRHACGHPGESSCQTIHLAVFRRLAKEAALGLCRQCRVDLLERATKAEQALKQAQEDAATARRDERAKVAEFLTAVGENLGDERLRNRLASLAVVVETAAGDAP